MKRNSNQIELVTPGAKTWLPWIEDIGSTRVDGYPDFSGFSGASRAVRENAWQEFLNSGQELEVIPDPEPVPEPTTPDWDGFNAAILADTAFNTYYATGLSTAPAVTTSIPAALTQVESKGQSAFALVYTGFCTAVNVSSADRDSWASIAQTYNLPVDFVNLIRG